jgi:hypothetical protein
VNVRKRVVVGLATLALMATACSSSGDVDWENYAPDVPNRIDAMAASGDCAGLQAEFDTAEGNDNAQRARTGDGNADLMAYIDAKMQDAGCYE